MSELPREGMLIRGYLVFLFKYMRSLESLVGHLFEIQFPSIQRQYLFSGTICPNLHFYEYIYHIRANTRESVLVVGEACTCLCRALQRIFQVLLLLPPGINKVIKETGYCQQEEV